jgi:peptidyl-tRNA hydrolase, PTH1 family
VVRLAVFLGNPGSGYSRTRHNAGWMVADALSFSAELVWRLKFKGMYASRGGCSFLKPETMMNLSGESVGDCMTFFRITIAELLVVHDDIDLEFGRVERKSGGGLGGHNGLRDIVRVCGSGNFERVRVGVGRPSRGSVSTFVLSRFSPEEEAQLDGVLSRAAALVEQQLSTT